MAESTNQAGTISAKEAAALLGLESERRVQQLAAEGYFQRQGTGRYITVTVVQGYIRFLKEQIERNRQSAGQARVSDQRARSLEIANAKADHSLIELSEAEAVIDEIAGLLLSEFKGFGSAMTRDIPMRRKIEAGIDGIFKRAHARIAEALSALRSSGEVVEADAEDDA